MGGRRPVARCEPGGVKRGDGLELFREGGHDVRVPDVGIDAELAHADTYVVTWLVTETFDLLQDPRGLEAEFPDLSVLLLYALRS